MKQTLQDAINKQINEELYSAYLYLDMSAFAKTLGFDGFANWFEIQYKEEMDHMMGLYHYLLEVDGVVDLQAVKKPDVKFTDIKTLFDLALEHEKHITKCINDLYLLATKESDFALQNFLNWYTAEQVEEEANARKYIDKLRIAGDNSQALLMLDQELMQRIYTPLDPMAKK